MDQDAQIITPVTKLVLLRNVDTGLGDRLIDLCGLSLLSCILTQNLPNIDIKSRVVTPASACKWGDYASEDISFPWGDLSQTYRQHGLLKPSVADTEACHAETEELGIVFHGQPGCSMHPLKVFRLLTEVSAKRNILLHTKNRVPQPDELASLFLQLANDIKPGSRIRDCLPADMTGVIGVHLRKSDKISDDKNFFHGTDSSDFVSIVADLKNYLKLKLIAGHRKFYVCSEDPCWKNEIENFMKRRCKDVELMTPDFSRYTQHSNNLAAVVDFFALSKCCIIVQGIAYSTFSMMASMINGAILVNFSKKARTRPAFFLNWWKPLLHLSEGINENERFAFDSCQAPDQYVSNIYSEDLINFLEPIQETDDSISQSPGHRTLP